MIDLEINKIAKDIKDIKIQGASKIEAAAINAIEKYIQKTNKYGKEFIDELIENINILVKQRPNEPKLRNSMNYILQKSKKLKSKESKSKLIEEIHKYKENTKKANEHISDIASELITNNSIIVTHCHSNLVEETLKKAYNQGKKFKVYASETRPRYQGRITSKRLSEYGLDVTLITEGATTHILKKADYFITGADVVFSDGSIVNKVGTLLISISAKYYKTPHLVLTSTHCCERDIIKNINEKIEQRSADEVWTSKEGKPDNLKIENPCFDIIPNELIDKFITEEGVFSPESLYVWINKT
jgi:ribose 1,5-bisphosphate isomerase